MKKSKNQIKGFVIICVVILTIFAGCVEQFERIGQQRDVAKPYREDILDVFENNIETEMISIDFSTFNGYIEVYLWEDDMYKIEVTKWAKAETPEKAKTAAENLEVTFLENIKDETTTVRLKVKPEEDTGADIVAYFPKKAFDTVELSSLNGHLKMDEVTASRVFLETTNGSIEVYITADDIDVKTVNGGIRGFYQGDWADIETVNGDINIQVGSSGVYTISNANGDINMTVDGDFTFDLEISHGRISVSADEVAYTLDYKDHKKGSTAEESDITITASTANGSITVTKK